MEYLPKPSVGWSLFVGKLGFTLIELLIVISIIGVLATVGLNTFPGALARARDSQRVDDARRIVAALQQFNTEKGRYAGSTGASTCLATCNSGAGGQTQTSWIPELVSDYLESVPQDPKDTSSPQLLYYYITNSAGTNYCLQISQERDASTSRNFVGTTGTGGNQVWKLRFSPSGPTGALCPSLP